MKRIHSIIRAFSVCCALVVVMLFVACSSDSMPVDAPVDVPADSLGNFELIFTGQTPTRATTTVITQEEANNFLVTIYKGSDIVRSATRLGSLNTSLPAGYGYRVMAENCTKQEAITLNDGWGQKRFAGLSGSFAIKAGQTTSVNVGCSVVNAAVEITFDQSMAEYFTSDYYVTIHDGDRTIVYNAATAGRTAYFNLDDDGTNRQITYTITAIGPKTIVKEGTIDIKQAKVSSLNFKYDISYFDFNITIDEQDVFVTDVINITDSDITVEDGTTEFNAVHESFTLDDAVIDTRATLGTDGTIVNWDSGDVVAVYDFQSTRRNFTATDVNGNQARFAGQVTARTQNFAAIYPYRLAAEAATSAATLAATLPTTQYAVAGNIASALNISVAKGSRNLDGSPAMLTFYNTTQLLRFDIPAYAEDKIRSILLTATTPIAGRIGIDYSGQHPTATIASTESTTITILPPQGINTFEAGTYYIASAPVQLAGFTLTYTCDGRTYTQTSTTTFGGTASHIYDLGTIDLISTPSVTATHVYDGGVLQGTSVTLTDAPIEGRVWSATIKNSSGTAVRTVSGTGDLTSDHTDTTWPYLPKGSYTVSYTFTASNGSSRVATTTFTVPAPTLTLTVDGYSAHTKYEAGDVTAANDCDRLTFYAPSAHISVAPSLMTNTNYTRTFTRSCNGQSATTTESTNSPSWADYTNVPVSGSLYTFSVTANFGGETVSASKQFRITGLPANFTPPTEATGWANDKGTTNFNSDHVRLGNYSLSQPHRIKNSSWFNIPAGIRMSLDYDIVLHRAAVNTEANVKAGDQTIVTCTESKYNNDVHNTGVEIFTTSANVTYVTCEGSYGSGATCSKVYKLFFQYSN